MAAKDYSSGEYSPTPSHMLPAFINGEPTGYTCLACGHLQKELDPVWEDICPACLKQWAQKNIPRMIPVKEAIEKRKALEPTVKVEKTNQDEITTKILPIVVAPAPGVWTKIRRCVQPKHK